jgi:hypothetical protein
MPDYQKAKIYKLWSPSKNLVYYGSTTQTLSQRLAKHISHYNCRTKNYSSFIILDCEDYKIELVEEYPCNNKQQLEKKEGEYIKANECVNIFVPCRTPKEYYEQHKEQECIRHKKYNQKYKEEIKEYQKNYRETTKQNNLIYKWLLMTGIIV